MQEKHLFEYAVIRVVPRVDREEFLNVGVVLYCAKKKYLDLIYTLDQERLLAFAEVVRGGAAGGPIGQLDAASRFRWLTAQRSTILQTSRVHPGFCGQPEEALRRLHAALVL